MQLSCRLVGQCCKLYDKTMPQILQGDMQVRTAQLFIGKHLVYLCETCFESLKLSVLFVHGIMFWVSSKCWLEIEITNREKCARLHLSQCCMPSSLGSTLSRLIYYHTEWMLPCHSLYVIWFWLSNHTAAPTADTISCPPKTLYHKAMNYHFWRLLCVSSINTFAKCKAKIMVSIETTW